MRISFSAILIASACAAGLAGCESTKPSGRAASTSAPLLAADAAIAAGISTQEATAAARLYTAKCMRCHKSYDPVGYSDAEWRSWMIKMSRKARLTSEQAELLGRYLEAFRTAASPAGGKTGFGQPD